MSELVEEYIGRRYGSDFRAANVRAILEDYEAWIAWQYEGGKRPEDWREAPRIANADRPWPTYARVNP